MSAVDQRDFFEENRGDSQPVSMELIQRQPTRLAARKLAVQVSGLEEKQIYMPLGIDKAQWSRIMSGHAYFPDNKEQEFNKLVDNNIILIWDAWQAGFDLVPREDQKDKRIRELEAINARQAQEIDTLIKFGVVQRPK